MERLFEAFVGALLRRRWRNAATGGARVVLGGPQLHFASAGREKQAFQMRPDITVVAGDDTHIFRIYDAKWKDLNTTEQNRGVTSEDIYQMASYASRYRCRRLALLYPSHGRFAA